MANWTRRFMDLADHVSTWSKDRSTKTGAVIVGAHKQILSVGYNGFPRNVYDNVEERHARPVKYLWTEHAERNAIYNAARSGVSTQGTTMYTNWFPCVNCARAIVQSGIVRVWVKVQEMGSRGAKKSYQEEFEIAEVMFAEAGVQVKTYG